MRVQTVSKEEAWASAGVQGAWVADGELHSQSQGGAFRDQALLRRHGGGGAVHGGRGLRGALLAQVLAERSGGELKEQGGREEMGGASNAAFKSRITPRDTWSRRQAEDIDPVRRAGLVWAWSCAPAA